VERTDGAFNLSGLCLKNLEEALRDSYLKWEEQYKDLSCKDLRRLYEEAI